MGLLNPDGQLSDPFVVSPCTIPHEGTVKLLLSPYTVQSPLSMHYRMAPRFGQEANPGLSEWASQVVYETVNQCRYGKNMARLLDQEAGVNVFYDQKMLYLERFDEPPTPGGPFLGECGDLTYMAGKKLSVYLGDQVGMVAANGQCPAYFSHQESNHAYLLLWPGKETGRVKRVLDLHPKTFPEGTLIVDPSFNQVIPVNKATNRLMGYTLHKTEPLEACAPQPFSPVAFESDPMRLKQVTPLIPLGFLQDLHPGSKETGLVFMQFNKIPQSNEPPWVVFFLMPSPDAPGSQRRPDLAETVPPLAQLKKKLETALGRPSEAIASDCQRYRQYREQQRKARSAQSQRIEDWLIASLKKPVKTPETRG